jgi:acetylornithine aminotransferase
MEAEDEHGRAAARGAYIDEAHTGVPGILSVRGLGLLVAAELEADTARQVAASALSAGLVVNPVTESALRLAPSLLVTEEDIDKAVAVLTAVIEGVDHAPAGSASQDGP